MKNVKSKKFLINIVSCSTIIIIGCIIINAYVQYCNYHIMEIKYDNMAEVGVNEKNNTIKTILLENKKNANKYVKVFANKIQDKMLSDYRNNLDELKFDIDHPNENTKLTDLLDENLSNIYINKDTSSNKPFVSSTSLILWDRSTAYIKNNNSNIPISVYDFNQTSHNKHLSQIAVDSIINMDDNYDLIFWEGQEPIIEHGVISDMDINLLLSQYDNYGLEVFKSYELLVPIYITDTGDVFGEMDTNALGYKNNNYKIIIIQKINMYDAIEPYISDLTYTNDQINDLNNELYCLRQEKMLYIVKSIIVSVVILVGSGLVQNKFQKSVNNNNME